MTGKESEWPTPFACPLWRHGAICDFKLQFRVNTRRRGGMSEIAQLKRCELEFAFGRPLRPLFAPASLGRPPLYVYIVVACASLNTLSEG